MKNKTNNNHICTITKAQASLCERADSPASAARTNGAKPVHDYLDIYRIVQWLCMADLINIHTRTTLVPCVHKSTSNCS